uniref:Uncharacterized protein n=1 Tax=Wuchereria bancrofti TaxID=6293 RepID=A0A1I8EQN6_WUCBA
MVLSIYILLNFPIELTLAFLMCNSPGIQKFLIDRCIIRYE